MLSRNYLKLIPVIILVLALDIYLWGLTNKPQPVPTVQPNIASDSATRASQGSAGNPSVNQTVSVGQINYEVLKQDQETLTKYLTVEGSLLGIDGEYSVYMNNLNDPETVTINPEKAWIPASTIKTFVALEAFRQQSLGLIDFNTPVTITAQNVVPTELETEDFPRLREGTVATIDQLVGAMIEQSDNTAYNTLLDILDRHNINNTLQTLGLTETVVGEKLNLDDTQLAADQAVPGYRSNTTTAKDLATLFNLIYNHKVPEADQMMDVLKKQKINTMIPALLPPGTAVAHKTGDWAPLFHDGGIVYKPNGPFVLSIFTDGGDPSNISKLAQVAFFQNPDTVGTPGQITVPGPSSLAQPAQEVIALAEPVDTRVLAASTTTPDLTAADLGISAHDLTAGPAQASTVSKALVTPDSVFYPFKRWIEDFQVSRATSNQDKANQLLAQSKSRLAEAKTLLASGNADKVSTLLKDSEQDLTQATKLADKDLNRDVLLLKTKQTLDLNYAVLNQSQKSLTTSNRTQFIDAVYSFYKQENKDVRPVVQQAVITNPTQQKPVVGTVVAVTNNTASLKLDDGTTQQVALDAGATTRSFQATSYQTTAAVNVGDKIAVVGKVRSDHTVVPQFIETHLPQELPKKKVGVVESINPTQGTITIVDQTGQQEVVNVTPQTAVSSTNTQVSIAGIKAGSEVAVYGVTVAPNPTSLVATPAAAPKTITPSTTPTPSVVPPSAKVSPTPTPVVPTPNLTKPVANKPVVVRATAVKVVINSSGKNEVGAKKPATPTKKQ